MKFYVDYQTGAGNFEFEGTIDEVMHEAVERVSYTQQNVIIYDENRKEVAILPWYGVQADGDDVITVDYSNFGFYGEWLVF